MGPGRSLDAEFELVAGIPAGNYRVIYDSIILFPVDVTFSIIHRRGDSDTVLVTWEEHFDPLPDGTFEAQPRERDEPARAVQFQSGDKLVYRYAGANAQGSMSYIPVGNPESEGGRHTNITLPH